MDKSADVFLINKTELKTNTDMDGPNMTHIALDILQPVDTITPINEEAQKPI